MNVITPTKIIRASADYVRLAVISSAIVLVAVSMIRVARDTAPKELRDSNTSRAR